MANLKQAWVVLSLLVGSLGSAQTTPEVLGFAAWKTARVEEARATLSKVEREKAPASAAVGPKDRKSSKAEINARAKIPNQRVLQAQLNLEVAQELSVNDYFILYVSQLKGRESFLEAAKKLAPEETAELMMAYQKQIAQPEGNEIISPVSASAPAAPAAKPSAN